jgi:prepilin-type processing-associated H-X9-DG protein
MTRLQSRRRCECARKVRRGFTYIDLLVSILCLACATQGFLGCRSRNVGTSNRVKCASNLRQIGQAILLYSNDNMKAYPRTRMSAGPDRTPTWGTGAAAPEPFADNGPAENDVTAALFMLLRTQDITSEVFTCPSSNADKDLYGGGTNAPINRSNFTDVKKNLSYSFNNPYASQSAVEKGWKWNSELNAEYAVAADIGPGTTGTGDDVLKITSSSSAKDMRMGNTNNHDKDGQNILYGDGHVAWESNPFVGVNRDHIYTTADGKIAASPVDANDSILLPTDD